MWDAANEPISMTPRFQRLAALDWAAEAAVPTRCVSQPASSFIPFSSITATPSSFALSSFDPASAPATT